MVLISPCWILAHPPYLPWPFRLKAYIWRGHPQSSDRLGQRHRVRLSARMRQRLRRFAHRPVRSPSPSHLLQGWETSESVCRIGRRAYWEGGLVPHVGSVPIYGPSSKKRRCVRQLFLSLILFRYALCGGAPLDQECWFSFIVLPRCLLGLLQTIVGNVRIRFHIHTGKQKNLIRVDN